MGKLFYKQLCLYSEIYPKYKSKYISILNKNSLNSPKILLCDNNKFKSRQSLSNYSFLILFKKIRCSYIIKILKYFIFAQKNGTNIRKASIHTVDRILNIFSKTEEIYLIIYENSTIF